MSFSASFPRPRSAALLLLCFCALGLMGCNEPKSTAEPVLEVSTTPSRELVTLYLSNGTDVSGYIESVTRTQITLDTTSEQPNNKPEALDRKRVQGLILATAAERAAARQITTNPELWIAAGRYVWSARQEINKNITPVPCKSDKLPLLHAQLNRQGQVQSLKLLAASGCEALDRAVIEGIRKVRFAPLPNVYSPDLYPMNYFYEPDKAGEMPRPEQVG